MTSTRFCGFLMGGGLAIVVAAALILFAIKLISGGRHGYPEFLKWALFIGAMMVVVGVVLPIPPLKAH